MSSLGSEVKRQEAVHRLRRGLRGFGVQGSGFGGASGFSVAFRV